MNTLDAITKMLTTSGTSKAALGAALGRSRNSIYNMYQKGTDVKAETLVRMADAMGYELILRGHGEEIPIDPPSAEQ